uniref:Uncharacterized protein n=1 Tax=Melanopsichium pennsylvanicum 4 TaxID=1398559 RepID=A0A077QYX6_9BASI|nr:conserved hypothetical protein [Melanopsichium pennsylvanicum 4]
MSGFIAFLLLVVAMGIGTLICGFVPLSLPLSHRMMRVLEVFGAGLLVGAAVTVVIPEASSALFSNVTPTPHAEINTLATNILHPHIALTITSQPQTASIHTHPAPQPWAWSFITKRFTPDSPHDLDNHHEHDHQHQPLNHAKTFSSEDAEHRLGSSILFGIVLMYVIDQFISGSGTSSIHNHDEPQDTAASNHSHHHQHSTQPTRPRLETHRLSKSFHQKVDPTAAPNAIRKVSSRASFTFFDRAQHAMTQQDEEAQIGSRAAQHGHTRKDGTHRSIESIATTCSSSDHDLPDDYDDESSHQHPHLSRLASDSVSDWNTTPLDRNGGVQHN